MGVRGRIPNPEKDQRKREYGWTTIPAAPVTEPAPERHGPHTERGQAQWVRWWAMPVSRMWSRQVDADVLERLLGMLEAQWVQADDRPSPSEIRNLEDRFG